MELLIKEVKQMCMNVRNKHDVMFFRQYSKGCMDTIFKNSLNF